MPYSPFTIKVVETIKAIPKGKVATYGQIALLAGNRRAARQVSRVLHTLSSLEQLPWQRVVNKEGRISLNKMAGYDKQKQLLLEEGVTFRSDDSIDLSVHLWSPE